jgi:hypothetical protein
MTTTRERVFFVSLPKHVNIGKIVSNYINHLKLRSKLSGLVASPVAPVVLACGDAPFKNGMSGPSSGCATPQELRTTTEGARLNATICPHNPNLVSWRRFANTTREMPGTSQLH